VIEATNSMKNLYISQLLKQTRISQNITLRELSENTNFSFQTLSKYEHELIEISDENLNLLFNSLNINIEVINYIEYSFMNDIQDLYEAIAFDYVPESKTLYKKIQQAEQYIEYSIYKDIYLVIRYIGSVVFNEDETEFLSKILLRIPELNIKYLQLFYDYHAINLMRKGKLIDAVNTIEQAISLGQHGLSTGLIYYHAGILYSLYGKLLKALRFCEQAENQFIRDRNHARLLNVQIHIATIHAKMKNYAIAKQSYLRILKEIEKTTNHDQKEVVLYNLAWFDFLNNEYESSLVFLSRIESDTPLTENGLFMKIASLSYLGNINESERLYTESINTLDNEIFKKQIEVIHLENTKRIDHEYESLLLDLYHLTKDKRDYENYEFTLNKLIAYYEGDRFYKKAIVYYQEKLKWKEWVFHESITEFTLSK